MKTHYSLNTELNCANVRLNDRVYLIEIPDLFKILNNEKKFVFVNFETEDYPSFLYNYKRVNYLQFIFKASNCSYKFKNKNIYDLRHSNVIVCQNPVNVTINTPIETHNKTHIEIKIKPVIEDITENVIEPLVENVIEPLVENVIEPLVKNVIEPLVENVVEPLVENVIEPLVENVIEPLVENVIEPLVENVIEPLVENVIEPLVENVVEPLVENVEEIEPSIRYHYYHNFVIKKYNVLEYIPGHANTSGRSAYIMKNPIWKVLIDEKEYYLMYCETDSICKLCPESYKIIKDYHNGIGKNVTWSKCSNGYIQSHIRNENDKTYYIHQIIMDCHGNGRGTKTISIDHIDRDPLNNTLENLRIANDETQQQNKKGSLAGTKRERKHNAIDLPSGITQDMMRKYVVYYHEWLDKDKTKEREFFKVESHPKLKDVWFSSKSNKISIQEKLNQANKVVDDLENDIQPLKEDSNVPKYVSLAISRGKPHLVFEKRMSDGKRLNFKMVLPDEYELSEQLSIFDERILKKYEKTREILSE